ncbi:MAG: mandelate racemase/muconate lactonizing enzyme family protein [Halobacteriaceae archaeon]
MRDFSGERLRGDSGTAIAGVETATVEGNFTWNFVRVTTDTGETGIGESYRGGGVTPVMEYVEDLLVGEDPLDVERLVRHLVQETSGHGGTTGKVVTAVSGVEVALWDLAGKLVDLPVYRLLGGKYRDEVRLYCDCHAGAAYEVEHGYTDYHGEAAYRPEAYAETARAAADEGFDALKFDLDAPADNENDPVNGRLTREAIERKREVVAAVEDAVPGVELAFDCHWDYSLDTAKRLARALEPYDLLWLEDVLPPENTDAQQRLARATATPLATGENRFRVHEFSELLYEGGVDIVTPDPLTCGGLAESKAIASRAEENYVVFAPHNVASPLGTVACAHLGAAVPNFGYLEYHGRGLDWWADVLAGPVIEDGGVAVPEGPGLGVELDESVAAAHSPGDGLF